MVSINPKNKEVVAKEFVVPQYIPKEVVHLHILHSLAKIVENFWKGIREAQEKRKLEDKAEDRRIEIYGRPNHIRVTIATDALKTEKR